MESLDGVPLGGQELPPDPCPARDARCRLGLSSGPCPGPQAHGPGEAAITVSALTSLRAPRGRSGLLCPL